MSREGGTCGCWARGLSGTEGRLILLDLIDFAGKFTGGWEMASTAAFLKEQSILLPLESF